MKISQINNRGSDVKKYEIFRYKSELDVDSSDAKKVSLIKREILKWISKRSGSNLPKTAWNFDKFELLSGGRTTLGCNILDEDINLWAVTNDDPDKKIPQRTWTTEISLYELNKSLNLTLRLIVNTSEDNIVISPHIPGVIRQIIDKGIKIKDGKFNIENRIIEVKTKEMAELLVEYLSDSSRKFPAIVLSGDERFGNDFPVHFNKFYCDSLQKSLSGLVNIFKIDSDLTYLISDSFGKTRSVFNGAARIYFPGFDYDSDPFSHYLYFSNDFIKEPKKTFDNIRLAIAKRSVRSNQLWKEIYPFDEIRSLSLQKEQESSGGATEKEKLRIAEERISSLTKEILSAREEQQSWYHVSLSEEERAINSERQLYATRLRIELLEKQLSDRGIDFDDKIPNPSSWDDFSEWVDNSFAGRLVLTSLARKNLKKPEFRNYNLAAAALKWLATECRNIRKSGGQSLANIKISENLFNAPCGTDEFEFEYRDRKISVDWHIKNGGNTRDPSRCLRIYYSYDEATQEIIIVDMPQHRRSSAS
ncbi:hypothetical protein [Gluconobacter sp. P1C6_b]|uniref:hypothetical protein n=1 Tax=Gluconobacter sp. P1C6_b TaxID=2762619 RepID=UPI001C04A135|nr:hypothetical protein [Gluconobacter sp. P1C6_b]